jgi:hypothetical protein
MSGNATSGIGNGAGIYPLRSPVLIVEKPRGTNRFDDERHSDQQRAHSRRSNETCKTASHSGTDRASDWNGARPNSVFVAQVLGQILNKEEYVCRSNRAAYRERGALPAQVYDAQV